MALCTWPAKGTLMTVSIVRDTFRMVPLAAGTCIRDENNCEEIKNLLKKKGKYTPSFQLSPDLGF